MVTKVQDEIDLWEDDCRQPKVEAIKDGCKAAKRLEKIVGKYKRMAKAVKKGTSPTVQRALKGLGWIKVWGIGRILKSIASTAAYVHGRAQTVETRAHWAEVKLKKLDSPCKKNKKIDKKIRRMVLKGQRALDKFRRGCGCNCLGSVDGLVAHSRNARSYCTSWPSLPSLPGLGDFTFPNWLEDAMNLIASIVAEIRSVMGTWIWTPWKWYTLGDILDGISWALSWIDYIIDKAISVVFSAIGFPCSSIASCLNMVIGSFLDRIPGLSMPDIYYSLPGAPHIPSPPFPSTFPFEFHTSCFVNAVKTCTGLSGALSCEQSYESNWWWRATGLYEPEMCWR
jgi:hypothetical protein